VKRYSIKQATRIVQTAPFDSYTKADEATWVVELPSIESGVRRILIQILGTKRELAYKIFYTNTSKGKFSAVKTFNFYNDRQTIEAFLKWQRIHIVLRILRPV